MFWVSFILGAIIDFALFGGMHGRKSMVVSLKLKPRVKLNQNTTWKIDRLLMVVRPWLQYAALYYGGEKLNY